MVPLHRTAPQQISIQPVLGLGVIPPQVQGTALAFVELPFCPSLQPKNITANFHIYINILTLNSEGLKLS